MLCLCCCCADPAAWFESASATAIRVVGVVIDVPVHSIVTTSNAVIVIITTTSAAAVTIAFLVSNAADVTTLISLYDLPNIRLLLSIVLNPNNTHTSTKKKTQSKTLW